MKKPPVGPEEIMVEIPDDDDAQDHDNIVDDDDSEEGEAENAANSKISKS